MLTLLLQNRMEYLRYLGAGAVSAAAVTTATALYLSQRPQPVPMIVDLNSQTNIVPGKDRARISKLCKNGELLEYVSEDVRTLHEAFLNGARVSNNGPCYGWKPSPDEPYKWISYNDVLVKAANFGAGLISKGQKPVNTTNIGLYSQNRVEYGIIEQACYMYSMVLVPLYDTLGQEACTFIVNQAEINIVICDKNVKVKSLLDHMKETPKLKKIVLMEEINDENSKLAKDAGIEIMSYADVESLGEQNPQKQKVNKTYTRLPKGAMLTHAGVIATVVACKVQLEPAGIAITTDDTLISYLPLAHSYERLIESYVYMVGGKIGFFQGDVRKLMDDIKELQPTLFATVPRLLNRFYDKVMAGVNASKVKQFMFNMAMGSKTNEIKRQVIIICMVYILSIIRNNSIWDKVVFKAIQQGLGGRVRLITTGSAPLSPKVLQFLRCCVGCPIVEGYGQTESHAICTMQLVGDAEAGNVGPPLACNYVKLADVPDMNYYAADNKGEICIKGPNVFSGYLKDPEKTKEALDDEHWLHTGDIGEWLPNGALKVIDRKKHIFKLAQGEYIAPEKIENIYIRSTLVAQIFVHGESLKSCLVGVVVPDPETFPEFAKNKLNLKGSMEELASNQVSLFKIPGDVCIPL
ncbi:hypothetical protein KUTeg_003185 [Tegillarca granosa]|uniref:long-chain-fatty-acid--CoA ligase n=1 Tax=Tegillarca granosa TaxID=220873 RepID=A0ABQ9FLE3_TEGGR|nr:hypothetical protein KUTeg_003185 [Tegillarca granosa]